jgi:hypothetical protein
MPSSAARHIAQPVRRSIFVIWNWIEQHEKQKPPRPERGWSHWYETAFLFFHY